MAFPHLRMLMKLVAKAESDKLVPLSGAGAVIGVINVISTWKGIYAKRDPMCDWLAGSCWKPFIKCNLPLFSKSIYFQLFWKVYFQFCPITAILAMSFPFKPHGSFMLKFFIWKMSKSEVHFNHWKLFTFKNIEKYCLGQPLNIPGFAIQWFLNTTDERVLTTTTAN